MNLRLIKDAGAVNPHLTAVLLLTCTALCATWGVGWAGERSPYHVDPEENASYSALSDTKKNKVTGVLLKWMEREILKSLYPTGNGKQQTITKFSRLPISDALKCY